MPEPSVLPRLRRATAVVTTAVCAVGLGSVIAVGAAGRMGYQVLGMKTGSMTPYVDPGDLVVAKPVPDTEVAVGDVISFRAPDGDRAPYTHRVVSRSVVNGAPSFETKGDANNRPDSWRVTYRSRQAYVVTTVVPHGGQVLSVVRSPAYRLLLLVSIFTLVLLLIWPVVVPRGEPAWA